MACLRCPLIQVCLEGTLLICMEGCTQAEAGALRRRLREMHEGMRALREQQTTTQQRSWEAFAHGAVAGAGTAAAACWLVWRYRTLHQ
jgi:hypothetical protein